MLIPHLFANADDDTSVETGPFASSLPLALLGYLPTIFSGVNDFTIFRTLVFRNWSPLNVLIIIIFLIIIIEYITYMIMTRVL